jgi:Primase C terminal 1 (PriCT-1)
VTAAFPTWQPRYAAHGVPTFPVTGKRPSIKGWGKIGLRASSQLARKFSQATAFGFNCGPRSRITIVDVDSNDEDVLAEAEGIFGESPLVWRTGSGNFAAAYRHRGEGRHIKPIDGLPIDLLGGGFAVLPESASPKGPYEFIRGGIDNLRALPFARPLPNARTTTGTIRKGSRNRTLFELAMKQARHVDDRDALIDVVMTRNLDCNPPLPDAEVVRIASSAWRYEERGENLFGRRGGAVIIPHTLIDELDDDPDALRLYVKLRRHHWGAGRFILANGLGSEWGWGWKRFRNATTTLVKLGIIACVHEGGRGPGDPPRYAWC